MKMLWLSLFWCLSFVTQLPGLADQGVREYHADYVVVGMGAAGAGVAKLLSDDPHNSVIGIEAGKNQDMHTAIHDSAMSGDLEPSYYATFFYQQEQLPAAFNGMQYHYTTGFLWGGGSSINGEQYVQGTNELGRSTTGCSPYRGAFETRRRTTFTRTSY